MKAKMAQAEGIWMEGVREGRKDGKDGKGAFVKMGQQSTDNLPPKRT